MASYLKRKQSNLCVNCGKTKGNNISVHCDICKKLKNQLSRDDKRHLKEKHRCLDCRGMLEICDNVRCTICKKKNNIQTSLRRKKLRSNGLCMCGKPATVRDSVTVCEDCWFKEIARKRTKATRNWALIKELLIKQEYKCAYTGKPLVVGKNASLDHIMPSSKGGSDKINNLQWVDIDINEMKNDFAHDDFLNTIKHILIYTQKQSCQALTSDKSELVA